MVRGWWSAILITSLWSVGGQAAIRSSHSHQPLLRSSSRQPVSPAIRITSRWSGVSAILITSLWSGVGGQPFSSCCCGQGLVVSYCHIMLLWSGVDGQLLSHHVDHLPFASGTLPKHDWNSQFLQIVQLRNKSGFFLLPTHCHPPKKFSF